MAEYVAFVPLQDQAKYVIDHLLNGGADWGRMYSEAWTGRFLAPHRSAREAWYNAIISELVWRGTY